MVYCHCTLKCLEDLEHFMASVCHRWCPPGGLVMCGLAPQRRVGGGAQTEAEAAINKALVTGPLSAGRRVALTCFGASMEEVGIVVEHMRSKEVGVQSFARAWRGAYRFGLADASAKEELGPAGEAGEETDSEDAGGPAAQQTDAGQVGEGGAGADAVRGSHGGHLNANGVRACAVVPCSATAPDEDLWACVLGERGGDWQCGAAVHLSCCKRTYPRDRLTRLWCSACAERSGPCNALPNVCLYPTPKYKDVKACKHCLRPMHSECRPGQTPGQREASFMCWTCFVRTPSLERVMRKV